MLKDLTHKLLIVLSLEYLVFFSAEVVLPGVIASAFNINILLGIILLLIGVLVIIGEGGNNATKKRAKLTRGNMWPFLLITFLLLINIIALYKVSTIMMLAYTIVVVVVVKFLWNNNTISN